MLLAIICLAILGGIALSIQSSVNGTLGGKVGLLPTAWLTFALGALLTFMLVFFVEAPHQATLLDAPKWQLTGAFFGVIYILVMVVAVPRVGIAAATVAVITGQLSMSIVIDHFGWLGNEVLRLDASRAGAIALLAGALALIYVGNRRAGDQAS